MAKKNKLRTTQNRCCPSVGKPYKEYHKRCRKLTVLKSFERGLFGVSESFWYENENIQKEGIMICRRKFSGHSTERNFVKRTFCCFWVLALDCYSRKFIMIFENKAFAKVSFLLK